MSLVTPSVRSVWSKQDKKKEEILDFEVPSEIELAQIICKIHKWLSEKLEELKRMLKDI